MTTERLTLTAVAPGDISDLFTLHSDPRVWTHLPSGVYVDREQMVSDVTDYAADWQRDGLGYWTARRSDDGAVVGIGGVRRRPAGFWNIYYRLFPEHQGHGFATEIARTGMAAASAQASGLPVLAVLLERNLGSLRTAQRLGLTRAWRGQDPRIPDPDAVRLVYADRPLPRQILDAVVSP
ncbi:GNAT family N-acetyltransferase [Microbacterium sp. SORGH_AS_0888]|uniref:GNAT family N-acetyltransferase n=1 Tax=Microbacterium sp. SORGH_AS_0888 TaxID=3041791 RepID=UPI0027D9196F|nr:GNAT family N-acetyltransferase [Microbacterium sp. SORGH_AS_0888]